MLLRRLLSRQVSVGSMIEFLMWLAVPYILVGVGWSFLHADQVARMESQLQALVPAGADVGAFGLTTLLWPLLLITPDFCI